jgi:uncharacterized RDD family membrane protein YckC
MNHSWRYGLALTLTFVATLAAATPFAPQEPVRPEPPASAAEPVAWRSPVVRIGGDYKLPAGEAVREVVVISGDATIDGLVDRDVVVVFGHAQLWSTADVEGSLVVIGGRSTISPGARVGRDLVVLASTFDAPASFSPGGGSVVIGSRTFGGAVEAVVPWLSRGLLWGRVIVPSLPWIWAVVAIVFVVYMALNLMLDNAVRSCARTLADRPFTSLGAGLLVLLLFGPICFLLAISVVGIAVIPFVSCAMAAAWIVGRVAVARWIGVSVAPYEPGNRWHTTRAFVIGFAVICLAYMLPLAGLVTWATVGVLGLGATTLTFLAAYRRENPPAVAPVVSVLLPTASVHQGGITMIAGSETADASVDPLVPASPGVPALAAPAPIAADLTTYPRASLGDRTTAAVLDVILVIIATQLLSPLLPDFTDDGFRGFLVVLLAYHVGFWTAKGTTVGGLIAQLRLVRVDGTPLRFSDALVRGLAGIFSVAVLGLGFFWIARDPERQAWHDRIAGTYVVKVPRGYV